MRPLTAPRVRNDAPVPLASRVQSRIPWFGNLGKLGQLEAMANNGTVFGIVDRIAPSVARTEWKLYRKAASGREEDRTEVTRHSALDLINRPNPHFTRMLLFETSQQHHDLTGEAPWVVSYVRGFARPLELWPVRPDRLVPVPHPTKYLAGWVYQSPDGEQVPLELHEVIFNRRPNPADPYRGMGPVQAVLTDIYGSKAAAEWNKNFFLNSAEPGGIIEIPRSLQDEDFQRLRMRWNEQHKGVSKAHRVAILEEGVWKDRKYTQRDMQFAELRGVSRDAIMEAFGFPKGMLGITEDVNRSNGEVGEEIFARWLVVPRLDRWRDVLNHSLLPLYGKDTAAKYEFDYDSPVPEDEAAENAARESKANTAKTYIDAGFTGESVQEALELPDALVWEKPEPQPAPAPPEPAPGGAPEPPAPEPAPTPTPRSHRGTATRTRTGTCATPTCPSRPTACRPPTSTPSRPSTSNPYRPTGNTPSPGSWRPGSAPSCRTGSTSSSRLCARSCAATTTPRSSTSASTPATPRSACTTPCATSPPRPPTTSSSRPTSRAPTFNRSPRPTPTSTPWRARPPRSTPTATAARPPARPPESGPACPTTR